MLILLGISMIDMPLASAGWLWDTANALGIFVLAASLYLFLFVGSGRHSRAHQLISYGVIVAAIGHVFLLWIPDKTIWHYAALDMPHYMWAGYVALLGLIATVVLALPTKRRYWHNRYKHFKSWHYYLSIAIIAFSLWHIIGSGFYFGLVEAWAITIFAILVGVLHRLSKSVSVSLSMFSATCTIFLVGAWIGIKQFA